MALKEAGVIDVLVRKLLSIKALRGRPVALLFSLFFSSFIVSMFIGFIPTALLYFGIYESIRDVCGYDKQDRFCKFMLLGIYLGCMGNFCFPFKGIALTIYTLINTSMQGFGLSINMFTYMFVCILVNLVWLCILAFMIPGVFKCNVAPLKELDIENVEALRNIPKKFNKRQKLILTIFCLSFLYIIVIPLLPKDFPGSTVLAPIGTTLIFLLALGILGLIKVDGKPLANPMKLLSEGTLWNVVCIVGCFTFLAMPWLPLIWAFATGSSPCLNPYSAICRCRCCCFSLLLLSPSSPTSATAPPLPCWATRPSCLLYARCSWTPGSAHLLPPRR